MAPHRLVTGIQEATDLTRLKAFALFMAVSCSSATAQNNTNTLEQALGQLPDKVFSNSDPMPILFLDVQGWRELDDGAPSPVSMRRLALAQTIRSIQPIGYGLDSWAAKSGISFDDLQYFIAFGQQPAAVTYWGLDSEQSTAQFLVRLGQAGFKKVDGSATGLLANGEARKIDITKVDAANPWRGTMGEASFVMPHETSLVQASSPDALVELAQINTSALDSEVISTTLKGLREAGNADGTIIQAGVISPLFGLEASDPAEVLSASRRDFEEARRKLKQLADQSGAGLPPYFGGIIADVQINQRPGVVISLAYGDCSSAEQAVDDLSKAWRQTMSTADSNKIEGRTVEAGGLCAAAVTILSETSNDTSNPIFARLMDKYLRRDFSVLKIGSSK